MNAVMLISEYSLALRKWNKQKISMERVDWNESKNGVIHRELRMKWLKVNAIPLRRKHVNDHVFRRRFPSEYCRQIHVITDGNGLQLSPPEITQLINSKWN